MVSRGIWTIFPRSAAEFCALATEFGKKIFAENGGPYISL